MMTFKDFLSYTEDANGAQGGMWGNIPGNPAFGGKKPSDGPGGKNNTMSSNQSAQGGAGGMGGGMPSGPMMMAKKMKKK